MEVGVNGVMGKRLLIIGASGHGKVAADIAIKLNAWSSIQFLDDNKNIKDCMSLKVIGPVADLRSYCENADVFVAIGDNQIRGQISRRFKNINVNLVSLIHPNVVIGEDVSIGEGTVIMAGVVINSSTRIGRGCILNTSCIIDHDSQIGDFVHISPGANLAGSVTIGEYSWIGIGSTIINNVSICQDCIIGAGSLVLDNIQQPGTYYGVPVKSPPKK